MPTIQFYFDFISPYSYLAFHQLPHTLHGLAHQVVYRPLVLGALLKAHGTPAPVGLPPKRAWLYRHCQWLAQQQALPFRMPAVHPFNPVPWLRMALAASPQGLPGRQVCETLFNALWQTGCNPDDAAWQQQVWQELTAHLPQVRDQADAGVKAELFANGDAALQQGVFGVPACVLLPAPGQDSSTMFWGVEGLPMLREAVAAQQPRNA